MRTVVLLGESRGENEDRINSCFVGSSGAELLRMLNESGIITLTKPGRELLHQWYSFHKPTSLERLWELHPEVYRTNVFQIHPPRNDLTWFCGGKADAIPGYPILLKSKYVRREFENELDRLSDELCDVNPNVTVCLGNAALWALTGKTAITKNRGYTFLSTHCVSGLKLVPTYHPAAVMRQWEWRPTVIADLIKAKRENDYVEIRRPEREIWIEPSLDDIRTFIHDHIRGCRLLSVDIETSGSRITCIGFSPHSGLAIVIPFDDERAKSRSYWPTRADEVECWAIVRSVLGDGSIPKLFQNGLYDISFLLRAYGIKVMGAQHDTMLMQHALQPESLKSLGYLGSLYSDEGAWKHLRKHTDTIKRDN
jgi:uracil-DNA glycosylase